MGEISPGSSTSTLMATALCSNEQHNARKSHLAITMVVTRGTSEPPVFVLLIQKGG